MSDPKKEIVDSKNTQQMQKVNDSIEVAIQLGDDKNRNFLWPMSKEKIRGTWLRKNVINQAINTEFNSIVDVPGQIIYLSTKTQRIVIEDPLNKPEYEHVKKQVLATVHNFFRVKMDVMPDKAMEYLTPSMIKSWLYWMFRFVESEKAVVVRGKMPDKTTISNLPGETSIQNFNTGTTHVKSIEELEALERQRRDKLYGTDA